MPGSATLDEDVLVDSLITDVIDGLRGTLHPQFGVRPYRVYTVVRTWSGSLPGVGTFVDDEVEIDPQPRVREWGSFEYESTPVGREDKGSVKVTEVSLSYTHEELVGARLAANQQFFIKIGEANGQENPDRYFTHAKPPYVDRERDMGWVLWLTSVSVPCND